MRKNIFFLIGTMLLLSACSKDREPIPSDKPVESRHTVLVYMSAQNSLSYQNCSSMDSAEIAQGTLQLSSSADNMILYLDDSLKPRIYRFHKDRKGKAVVQKIRQYDTDLNSSDPNTLRDVLAYVKDQFPSQSYGLVLWSHGMSWIPDIGSFNDEVKRPTATEPKGFGVDVGPDGNCRTDKDANGLLGQQMEIDDLAWAVESSGVHPVYIFFDACLMQTVEVAYALRNATDYIIGSPATTSGYGAYYIDQMRRGLFCYPFNEDSIRNIVDTYYYDSMENPSLTQLYAYQGCVMSVVKTSELEHLAQATARALAKCIKDKAYPDLTGVQYYTSFVNTSYPDHYDINSAFRAWLDDADYQVWKEALDHCLVYSRLSDKFYVYYKSGTIYTKSVDYATACGLAMFFPKETYEQFPYYGNLNTLFRDTQWYEAAQWAQTGW
ncbi:MAG: hypothetical protein ILA34_00890 [Bacteroidaceae bacterium]|nr:hypothetical protein [Bacteroidaceae bacterium]